MQFKTNLRDATEKTGQAIRGLQSRLVERGGEPPPEPGANLAQELEEYFARGLSRSGGLDRLRERVLDSLADRIFRSWDSGQFESELMERLTRRAERHFSSKKLPTNSASIPEE